MKQKGQGIVEFAIIVPVLVMLGVAIIYVGIMFLDYTQYSNAARDAARDISLQAKFIADDSSNQSEHSRNAATMRQTIADALNGGEHYNEMVARYQHPFTNIYEATWSVNFYKWNETKRQLELNGTQGNTQAQGAKAVEVKIGMKFKQGVETGGEWGGGFSLERWFADNFSNLPPITYKMVLEE